MLIIRIITFSFCFSLFPSLTNNHIKVSRIETHVMFLPAVVYGKVFVNNDKERLRIHVLFTTKVTQLHKIPLCFHNTELMSNKSYFQPKYNNSELELQPFKYFQFEFKTLQWPQNENFIIFNVNATPYRLKLLICAFQPWVGIYCPNNSPPLFAIHHQIDLLYYYLRIFINSTFSHVHPEVFSRVQ